MRLATQATMLASVRIGPRIVVVGDRGVVLVSDGSRRRCGRSDQVRETVETASVQRATAALTIDLGAVVADWRLPSARLAPTRCGAVVEADADRLDAWRR